MSLQAFSAVSHAFRLLLFHSLEQEDTACPVVLLAVIYVVCVRHLQSVRKILSTKDQQPNNYGVQLVVPKKMGKVVGCYSWF